MDLRVNAYHARRQLAVATGDHGHGQGSQLRGEVLWVGGVHQRISVPLEARGQFIRPDLPPRSGDRLFVAPEDCTVGCQRRAGVIGPAAAQGPLTPELVLCRTMQMCEPHRELKSNDAVCKRWGL